MGQKDRYSSVFKGLTGRKPASTAASRASRIEQEMAGTYVAPKKKKKKAKKKKKR